MRRSFFLFWEGGPIHEIEMEAEPLGEEPPGRRLKWIFVRATIKFAQPHDTPHLN